MAIAVVNTTSGNSNTGATTLPATAASHTTGNLLVVCCVWSGNVNANVPTDTALNTYVSTGQKANNGTTDHSEIFYAKNITGNASNIVTANFAASATFRRVMVYQISGCDTSAPFTVGEGGTAVALAAAAVTTTSWTTATADEILFGGAGTSGAAATITPGTGYTNTLAKIGTDSHMEFRIVSATGTYTAGYTSGSNQDWWLSGASFKILGGGGGGATVKTLAALGAG